MDDNMSNPSSSSTTTITTTKKKRNKGVRLSTDPQSIAARERRHRISDRFKILQSLVPGGTKMDTVSMLEEAIHYVKFLKTQIWLHETMMNFIDDYDHDLDDPSPPSDHHFFTDPPPSTTNLDYLSSALPPPCGFQVDDAKPILPNVSKNYFP